MHYYRKLITTNVASKLSYSALHKLHHHPDGVSGNVKRTNLLAFMPNMERLAPIDYNHSYCLERSLDSTLSHPSEMPNSF